MFGKENFIPWLWWINIVFFVFVFGIVLLTRIMALLCKRTTYCKFLWIANRLLSYFWWFELQQQQWTATHKNHRHRNHHHQPLTSLLWTKINSKVQRKKKTTESSCNRYNNRKIWSKWDEKKNWRIKRLEGKLFPFPFSIHNSDGGEGGGGDGGGGGGSDDEDS